MPHLKVSGKGGKTRYVPLHPAASGLIAEYLEAAGRGGAEASPLFRPLHHSRDPQSAEAITPDGVYRMVRKYSAWLGFEIGRIRCARPRRPMRAKCRAYPICNRRARSPSGEDWQASRRKSRRAFFLPSSFCSNTVGGNHSIARHFEHKGR